MNQSHKHDYLIFSKYQNLAEEDEARKGEIVKDVERQRGERESSGGTDGDQGTFRGMEMSPVQYTQFQVKAQRVYTVSAISLEAF